MAIKHIIRAINDKNNPYVIINKIPLNNSKLSWKARGILVWMLSRPDDWEFNFKDLENRSEKDGADSIRSGVKELRDAGHIKINPQKNDAGKITKWIWTIYEIIEQGKDHEDSEYEYEWVQE